MSSMWLALFFICNFAGAVSRRSELGTPTRFFSEEVADKPIQVGAVKVGVDTNGQLSIDQSKVGAGGSASLLEASLNDTQREVGATNTTDLPKSINGATDSPQVSTNPLLTPKEPGVNVPVPVPVQVPMNAPVPVPMNAPVPVPVPMNAPVPADVGEAKAQAKVEVLQEKQHFQEEVAAGGPASLSQASLNDTQREVETLTTEKQHLQEEVSADPCQDSISVVECHGLRKGDVIICDEDCGKQQGLYEYEYYICCAASGTDACGLKKKATRQELHDDKYANACTLDSGKLHPETKKDLQDRSEYSDSEQSVSHDDEYASKNYD